MSLGSKDEEEDLITGHWAPRSVADVVSVINACHTGSLPYDSATNAVAQFLNEALDERSHGRGRGRRLYHVRAALSRPVEHRRPSAPGFAAALTEPRATSPCVTGWIGKLPMV